MISDEKGYALPLVFVIMLVLALLSTALWFYGTSETTQVSRQEKRARAYYYALSGIGITEKILDDDKGINLLKTGDDPFYLSGPLGSEPVDNEYEWELSFTEPANGVDISVKVNYEIKSLGLITGEIISKGHYLGVTRTIQRDFQYVMVANAADLDWIILTGNLRINWGENIDRDFDYPVEFSTEDGDAIDVSAAAERFISAPIMFFKNRPDSIIMKFNSERVSLIADQLFFDGNIIFTRDNNDKTGKLALKLRGEGFSAENIISIIEDNNLDIGDVLEFLDGTGLTVDNINTYSNYGVLCLGALVPEDITLPEGENTFPVDIYTERSTRDYIIEGEGGNTSLGPGWYFFPDLEDGLNLSDTADLYKLIRINDPEPFGLGKFSLGMLFGAYR